MMRLRQEDLEGPITARSASAARGARRACGCCLGCCRRVAGACLPHQESKAWFVYVAMNIAIAGIGFWTNSSRGFNQWYALAKTGGYILDLNLSTLLLPTLRSLQNFARQVRALDGLFNADPIGF